MPFYLFYNPKTHEIKEVKQKINDPHVYNENGIEWDRIFTVPNASVDTKVDPFSSNEFKNKTEKKKMTVGDMWDASKEASLKREQKAGVDKIKEKHFKDYSKKRRGIEHPESFKKKDIYTI